MILYLHGFRSSPQSFKARLMEQALRKRDLLDAWVCPQLPPSPARAAALCNRLIEQARTERGMDPATDQTVIGSSLGGYYANYVAERWHCRAVVLNPAVYPLRSLASYVGTQTLYHSGDSFEFLPEYLDEIGELATSRPTHPERYFLLACKGDEVLDWRDMAAWYQGSHGHILEGGDHSLSDFERWLPQVLDFALGPDQTNS